MSTINPPSATTGSSSLQRPATGRRQGDSPLFLRRLRKRGQSPSPQRSSLCRRGSEAIVALLIAVLLADAFVIDGWIVPSVVSSGSMAPELLGPHRIARCEACGMPLVCDADALAIDSLVCPNCGWSGNPLDPRTFAGNRLLIDRSAFDFRPPRRWEIVLFRCPSHANDHCVKRIAGLPGETVEIRDGDVYVDGQIARKSLAEQRGMAQLVHDSAYRDPRMPPRWRAEEENSDWSVDHSGVWSRSAADDRPSQRIDWLSYLHWRRVPGSPERTEEAPIRDDDPYNTGTSRRLTAVADLMLVAQLRLTGSGMFYLRANDGRESFQLDIRPALGQLSLKRDGRDVQTSSIAAKLLDRPFELVLSTFDRRLLLAIDDRTELAFDYERTGEPVHSVSRPFSIGASDLAISVARLQLFRDVYYTPPVHPAALLARRLGEDEYFVLGDNSPISVDSRDWMGGETVPRRLIVGRVLNGVHRRP